MTRICCYLYINFAETVLFVPVSLLIACYINQTVENAIELSKHLFEHLADFRIANDDNFCYEISLAKYLQ